ncbi:NUDIX domain-containing protein [soil metagenome]
MAPCPTEYVVLDILGGVRDVEEQPSGDAPCWAHLEERLLYERIRKDVAERVPVDDRERESMALFLEHFDRLISPFDEESSPVHVTGSAVVVGPRGVVLHRHRRLGTWIQPGGHIDDGETPWEAARREAQEETGLPVRFADLDGGRDRRGPALLHVDVHPGPRGHTHLDLRYLLESEDVQPNPAPGESDEVQWFAWGAAIERTTAGLSGLLASIRRGVSGDDQ